MNDLVKIYTVCDVRPDFLRWQRLTFERFLADRYRLIVCDNARLPRDSLRLALECRLHGLERIVIPGQRHENANVACSYPLDWLMQERIARETAAAYSVFIDSDMFLVRPFSFVQYVGGHALAAVPQHRGKVRYLWNALVVFNHARLPDPEGIVWACSGSSSSPYYPAHLYADGRILGEYVDVGGPIHFWLEAHPDLAWRAIDMQRLTAGNGNLHLLPEDLRDAYLPFARAETASDLLADGAFFHYRAGSNWNGMRPDEVRAKTRFLQALLSRALGRSRR